MTACSILCQFLELFVKFSYIPAMRHRLLLQYLLILHTLKNALTHIFLIVPALIIIFVSLLHTSTYMLSLNAHVVLI